MWYNSTKRIIVKQGISINYVVISVTYRDNDVWCYLEKESCGENVVAPIRQLVVSWARVMLVFTSFSTILSSSLISHHRFQTIQMVLLQGYNHMPHHTILEAFLCHSSHQVDSGTIPFDSKSPKHRSGHETLAGFNSSSVLQTRRLMGDTSRKGESWWKCCRAHATTCSKSDVEESLRIPTTVTV